MATKKSISADQNPSKKQSLSDHKARSANETSHKNLPQLTPSPKKIYVVAGEESGDMLGAGLMKCLIDICKQRNMPLPNFYGVGGSRMQEVGLSSIYPMHDLSVMGFIEVVPNLLNILSRLNQTYEDIKRTQPDVVITIDAPGFNFKLGKKLKSLNIPVVHYTAPSVWAWKPRRAEKVATFLKHMLCLFPFEPPYFQKHGLESTFVGHPLSDMKLNELDPAPFIKSHGLKKTNPILCVMLGSRKSELNYHKPIFSDVIEILKTSHPKMQVVSPTLPHLRSEVEHFFKARGISAIVTDDEQEKYQAIRAATTALVASGTATLEVGLAETPMVVAYRGNPVSAWIVRQLIKIPYVSLVNILKDEKVVEEYLQEECQAEQIAVSLNKLLDHRNEAYVKQKKSLQDLQNLISADSKKSPSVLAAETILDKILLV